MKIIIILIIKIIINQDFQSSQGLPSLFLKVEQIPARAAAPNPGCLLPPREVALLETTPPSPQKMLKGLKTTELSIANMRFTSFIQHLWAPAFIPAKTQHRFPLGNGKKKKEG